jgi:hypothetical protein
MRSKLPSFICVWWRIFHCAICSVLSAQLVTIIAMFRRSQTAPPAADGASFFPDDDDNDPLSFMMTQPPSVTDLSHGLELLISLLMDHRSPTTTTTSQRTTIHY